MQLPALAAWAWIPIVIWAAFAQTIRNATQRTLVAELGTLSATLVRFLYGLPFAFAWLLVVYRFLGPTGAALGWPPFTAAYAGWVFVGAAAQLAATAFLLQAMRQRNFIVGVTFSKTEVLQVGIFATIFLHELPSLWSALAMVVATVGVILLSVPKKLDGGARVWAGNAAWFGLGSGACFALSSVGYRGASLQWSGSSPWLIGAWAVVLAQSLQSVVLGSWLGLRAPGALASIAKAWRLSLLAGMMGALASIGWLTATAMRPAGDVRTLGLVEVLFSYLVSRRLFNERMTASEVTGLLLVSAGVLVVCAQL
ncbi:MAG: DMT family transporter [Rhodoferax sp.]|nr:DMT family transporter [Rhodoferax sp.]